MDLERTIAPVVRKVSKTFPVLLLTGMRQIGKTFLLESIKEQRRTYVSLDSLDSRELAKTSPALFIQRYSPPVLIDEVQYAPELFPYIKMYVDSHKKDGLFWLTGSQKFSLMKGVRESLAGRVAILDMMGLSYREMIRQPRSGPFLPSMGLVKTAGTGKSLKMLELYRIIWKGSFPRPLVKKGLDRKLFYKSYIRTYIERDIKDYQGITDDLKFYNFIRAAAVRSGCLLNYADLARDADIDVRTAKLWLAALERSGLVRLLNAYHNNITKRIVKTPKLYFMDTGLASYLAGMGSAETLEASYLNGRMLETWVFTEILKSYWHNGDDPDIYFYRDADQREIDFLIERDAKLYPVEVKKTAAPLKKDVAHFELLKKLKKPLGPGALLCLCSSAAPLTEKAAAVPVWEI